MTTNKCPASGPGVVPDLSQPLVQEPTQSCNPARTGVVENKPEDYLALGPLTALVGTWTNQPLGTGNKGGVTALKTGGQDNPYSYNIMPLPEAGGSGGVGYILKNFNYYEEITFSPIHGAAPNRGGNYTQTCNTLFYEQRVFFGPNNTAYPNPNHNKLVHAENGSWLYQVTGEQGKGPYPGGGNVKKPSNGVPLQNKNPIAKQISVPHGNSVLALGTFGIGSGPPPVTAYEVGAFATKDSVTIDDYTSALPTGVSTAPYSTPGVGNPMPSLNSNPNKPLQDGNNALQCKYYIRIDVNTSFIPFSGKIDPGDPDGYGGGSVTNIPFEMKKAEVESYLATYWIQSVKDASSIGDLGPSDFTQLTYTQTMVMKIPIGTTHVHFPHVTGNILTRQVDL